MNRDRRARDGVGMNVASHSMSLPAAAPGAGGGVAVPEWVHLVPAGSFSGRDGRGPWRVDNAAAVIAATNAAGTMPLPIDEAHAIDLGAASGQPGPARGWVEELEARADGIWGRVAWTPTGTALLSERSYRGISPTFRHAKDGQVLALLRAALTNMPNLPQLATINHQDIAHMDLLAQLRQLHGLAADADAATAFNACRAAHEAVAAHGTALNALAAAAGLSPGMDATTMAAAIATSRAAAGDAARMGAELVALQTQLTTMQTQQAHDRAVAAVDGAIRAGKPIPKTLRDHYIARHAKEPEVVEKELAALPNLNTGGAGGRVPQAEAGADPVAVARQAQKLQDDERAAGREISFAEAVQTTTARNSAAA